MRWCDAPGASPASLSLHGARAEIRRRLVPLAAVHELGALRHALEEVSALLHRPVMIEHLLLEGLTDTAEDIAALVEFLAGLRVHINLIPFNAIEDAPDLKGTGRERREAFAVALREAGFKVTLRYSLGADISAACGQLVRGENLEVARARSAP
jgi:23S rRNA (adenine2503-C2)-methyltransferase